VSGYEASGESGRSNPRAAASQFSTGEASSGEVANAMAVAVNPTPQVHCRGEVSRVTCTPLFVGADTNGQIDPRHRIAGHKLGT
jgi:hypothetical protein